MFANESKYDDDQDEDEEEDESILLSTADPTTTTSATVPKSQTNNTRNQRRELEKHGIFFNEESAIERNQDFIDEVTKMLKGDRFSATSDRMVKEIQDLQEENATSTENKYASEVVPLMLGNSRTVKEKSTIPDDNQPDTDGAKMIEHVKHVARDFKADRLHYDGPCYFVKNLIAGPRRSKMFVIKDPRPDLVFGIRNKKMDWHAPKLSNETENLIHVAGSVNHAFFLIELKGPDVPTAHAETQAIRGGATLVKARRALREKAGYPHVTRGPDRHTWVYTCAWEHGFAMVYVSWHEIQPEGEAIHMHRLESYALHKKDDVKEFRRDLHNILDWGLDPKRVTGVEEMVRTIAKRESP